MVFSGKKISSLEGLCFLVVGVPSSSPCGQRAFPPLLVVIAVSCTQALILHFFYNSNTASIFCQETWHSSWTGSKITAGNYAFFLERTLHMNRDVGSISNWDKGAVGWTGTSYIGVGWTMAGIPGEIGAGPYAETEKGMRIDEEMGTLESPWTEME